MSYDGYGRLDIHTHNHDGYVTAIMDLQLKDCTIAWSPKFNHE